MSKKFVLSLVAVLVVGGGAIALATANTAPASERPLAETDESAVDQVAADQAGAWITYDEAQFIQAQADGERIIVDVTASWCPTCKAQAPTLDAMVSEPELGEVKFVKVDFDAEKAFLEQHRIPRQSTIVVFQGATETARTIAETDPERLRAAILAGV